MRIRDIGFSLAGGAAIYVAMAACSAADGAHLRGANGAGGNGQGGSGQGGSGVIPDATAATSGSRLRVRYYSGEDGSKQFVGWHDTQRNEDCTFRPAADDAGCTQPVAIVAKTMCAGAPKYAYAPAGQCSSGYTVLQVAGTYSAATIYQGAPGACSGTSTSSVSNLYDFYNTQGEVAVASFVAATQTVE